MVKKIIALGFFDGVHRGHQAVLGAAVALAGELGLKSGAVTFESHPRSLILGRAPQLITTVERRRQLILAQGVEHVIILPFNAQTAAMAPEDFAARLIKTYGAVGVVCGQSFRFGHDAAGTPQLLEALGLRVHICPKALAHDGQVISSTAIRALVRQGEMERAADYLGRPFAIDGLVTHGQAIGRRLGFPTLNLTPGSDMLLPRRGVYSGHVALPDGRRLAALTNVGSRPTFTSADIVSVESHLLDFSGDLYGSAVSVELARFIRPELAFDSAEALRAQIARDLAAVRSDAGMGGQCGR